MIGQDAISLFSKLTPITISLFLGLSGLLFVCYLAKRIFSVDAGTEKMRKIQHPLLSLSQIIQIILFLI